MEKIVEKAARMRREQECFDELKKDAAKELDLLRNNKSIHLFLAELKMSDPATKKRKKRAATD